MTITHLRTVPLLLRTMLMNKTSNWNGRHQVIVCCIYITYPVKKDRRSSGRWLSLGKSYLSTVKGREMSFVVCVQTVSFRGGVCSLTGVGRVPCSGLLRTRHRCHYLSPVVSRVFSSFRRGRFRPLSRWTRRFGTYPTNSNLSHKKSWISWNHQELKKNSIISLC